MELKDFLKEKINKNWLLKENKVNKEILLIYKKTLYDKQLILEISEDAVNNGYIACTDLLEDILINVLDVENSLNNKKFLKYKKSKLYEYKKIQEMSNIVSYRFNFKNFNIKDLEKVFNYINDIILFVEKNNIFHSCCNNTI